MSDLLVEMSAKPWFRQAVKNIGLPLPTPQMLRRAKGATEARPLEGRAALVCTAPGGRLTADLARTLAVAGAIPHVVTNDLAPAWSNAGEAWGRPPVVHAPGGELPDELKVHALVFDGTGLSSAADLRALYDFFHGALRHLAPNGRVVVLGRPAEGGSVGAAGASAALDGFARSLAKEIGRKGSTAHVVYVPEDAHDRVEGLLRFLLSPRSAFISGQPWTLSATVAGVEGDAEWVQPLSGQTVLLTGAARGIGAATVRLLADEGAHVICLDRPGDEELLGKVAREIGGTALAVDITDPEAGAQIQAFLEAHDLTLDAVVHNAGITRDKTLGRMKPEWWDQAVAVNFGAVVDVTTQLLERGLADGGRVVCLSSVAGLAGNVGQTNYSASKAGLVGYVRALAGALADRNINVNAIAPGFIETRLTAAIPAVTREVGRRLSALGQGGLPRDVGDAITFLCTPAASGLTGQVVRVCGGMFIGA